MSYPACPYVLFGCRSVVGDRVVVIYTADTEKERERGVVILVVCVGGCVRVGSVLTWLLCSAKAKTPEDVHRELLGR